MDRISLLKTMIPYSLRGIFLIKIFPLLYSPLIITPSILPYVLSLKNCADIWATLSHRLQASTRSRIIQLKNELYHLSKGEQSMSQYLLTIKSKIDTILAADSTIDPEDVILYTLNGLPKTYQAFKIAIRTNLQPINLDDLYTLLCSEEVNLAQETSKELQSLHLIENSLALVATRGCGHGRNNANCGCSYTRNTRPAAPSDRTRKQQNKSGGSYFKKEFLEWCPAIATESSTWIRRAPSNPVSFGIRAGKISSRQKPQQPIQEALEDIQREVTLLQQHLTRLEQRKAMGNGDSRNLAPTRIKHPIFVSRVPLKSSSSSIKSMFDGFEDSLLKSSSFPLYDEPMYDMYDNDIFIEVLDLDQPVYNEDASKVDIPLELVFLIIPNKTTNMLTVINRKIGLTKLDHDNHLDTFTHSDTKFLEAISVDTYMCIVDPFCVKYNSTREECHLKELLKMPNEFVSYSICHRLQLMCCGSCFKKEFLEWCPAIATESSTWIRRAPSDPVSFGIRAGKISPRQKPQQSIQEALEDIHREVTLLQQHLTRLEQRKAMGNGDSRNLAPTRIKHPIFVSREEIQRIKAAQPDIPHREAFSTAAKNWAKCDPRALFYSATGTSGVRRATAAIQQEKRSGVPVESLDVSKHGQLHRME
ncbi:hypothetical protein KFK09_016059 [Dendrobium nobile]|uniref:YABBY protein C-terminal domain-containing protein n=1 Tax=Dendrobium nobile TaxID=94219 RepID=A0A8T3AX04_DENNO|nr:hypothetical protein KFK09_016059 [Dendrobium nobile]